MGYRSCNRDPNCPLCRKVKNSKKPKVSKPKLKFKKRVRAPKKTVARKMTETFDRLLGRFLALR